MNPSYRIQIDVTLCHVSESKDIYLRRMGYLPFVPRAGDTLQFTSEDEEYTLDLTLGDVAYSVAEGMFLCSLTDNSIIESLRDEGREDAVEAVKNYTDFGFLRLNYATAQAVRRDT